LEIEKCGLTEKITACGTVAVMDFNHKFREAMHFLENPLELWGSDQLCHKRTVIKLAFAERLVYKRNFGFQTPTLSLPFVMLQAFQEGKKDMVEQRGETSNRMLQFIEVIQEWEKLFKAPPVLIGKSFQWEPLLVAA